MTQLDTEKESASRVGDVMIARHRCDNCG